jgi:hypothetical protein
MSMLFWLFACHPSLWFKVFSSGQVCTKSFGWLISRNTEFDKELNTTKGREEHEGFRIF